jgi:ribosomal-protein-alanine N-acetyltransferase
MKVQLIPIANSVQENKQFDAYPLCRETLAMSVEYYGKVGFNPPWICYFALEERVLVGSGGFKGKPREGRVEIAYGTFEQHQRKGIGTAICNELIRTALEHDPSVRICARTLPDNQGSIGVLRKNNFRYTGLVNDEEDGEVCEWEFIHLSGNGM